MGIAATASMQCLWPSANPKSARKQAFIGAARAFAPVTRTASTLLLLSLVCGPVSSSVLQPSRVGPQRQPLSRWESSFRRAPAHVAEFTPAPPALALMACEDVRPAEALLTPDPLLPLEPARLVVRVSLIIGSDGRVHSAFVLSSSDTNEDAAILRAVRAWRYRPAMCNGVPTDSEVRVRFSFRE